MTSFVSWRSIVVHIFLVECTKLVSLRIPIEEILAGRGDLTVFSRAKASVFNIVTIEKLHK